MSTDDALKDLKRNSNSALRSAELNEICQYCSFLIYLAYYFQPGSDLLYVKMVKNKQFASSEDFIDTSIFLHICIYYFIQENTFSAQ